MDGVSDGLPVVPAGLPVVPDWHPSGTRPVPPGTRSRISSVLSMWYNVGNTLGVVDNVVVE